MAGNAPYIKSGARKQPQQLQLHKPERVYFKFYSAAGALLDVAVPATALVTFKDQDGAVITDFAATPLEDVQLSNQSTGIYYYLVDLAAAETATVIYAFPAAPIDSIPTTMDVPIAILVRAEEEVESTENYCNVEDVEGTLAHRKFTTTSKPTRNQTQVFIDNRSGEINDYLAVGGYTTPITGTRALSRLKQICCWGVAADVEAAPNGNLARAEYYRRMYDQALKEIKAGDSPLSPTSGTDGNIAERNLGDTLDGLGTDTAIEDADKAPLFNIGDEY